ncbi:hypothetical protein Vi05172_g7784 [Venturia inaequalis]|nr:hypothetical protein Vi05172_g7784 [Venturia inaequalis]
MKIPTMFLLIGPAIAMAPPYAAEEQGVARGLFQRACQGVNQPCSNSAGPFCCLPFECRPVAVGGAVKGVHEHKCAVRQ